MSMPRDHRRLSHEVNRDRDRDAPSSEEFARLMAMMSRYMPPSEVVSIPPQIIVSYGDKHVYCGRRDLSQMGYEEAILHLTYKFGLERVESGLEPADAIKLIPTFFRRYGIAEERLPIPLDKNGWRELLGNVMKLDIVIRDPERHGRY